MNENRLSDYLDHIRQAATDACDFVAGLDKDDFLADKRTQQAVIMSLIICGKLGEQVDQLLSSATRIDPCNLVFLWKICTVHGRLFSHS